MSREHKPRVRFQPPLWALASFLLIAGVGRIAAQDLPWGAQEPDYSLWAAFAPQLQYVKTEVELQQSSYRLPNGATSTWRQLDVMPALGIRWSDYVYNPYLLNYSLLFEPGYDYQRIDTSGSPSLTREVMLNGTAVVNMLAAKPYATSVSFGRSRQELRSDFFNSQTVDLQAWDVVSGYRAGAVPVTLTMDQSREDRIGDDQEFVTDQLKLGLRAVNQRANSAMTVFDWQFDRYDNRTLSGGDSYSSGSNSHHAQLTDREIFAQSTLASLLDFNRMDMQGADSSNLDGSFDYNRDLSHDLHGFGTYSFGTSSGDGYDSTQQNLVVGLNHQLYDSLSSHLDLHGLYSDNSSAGDTLDSSSYGATASVDYGKHLGDWAHLFINNSASYDLTSQTGGGGEITIPDESYAIPATGPMLIRLKTPLDLSITGITKNNVPLDAGEWQALTAGDPWQIQFFGGGAHSVTNGDTIVITYVVQSNPSGNYATTNYSGEISLRFWREQAGIRADYVTTDNRTSSEGFVLQNIRQYQLGADAGWHGVLFNATLLRENSTLYSYRSRTLGESYSRPVSFASTLGVNFDQQWTDYPGGGSSGQTGQDLRFYSYMLHYDWHPAGAFTLNAETGLQQQRGTLDDQNLFAARIHLDWVYQKLEFHCGYEHENLRYVADVYTRNYVFIKMRRNF